MDDLLVACEGGLDLRLVPGVSLNDCVTSAYVSFYSSSEDSRLQYVEAIP